jgi:hypothetical protein
MERDDGLLASFRDDADLELALLDVIDGVRCVSLRKDLLFLSIRRHCLLTIEGAEVYLDAEVLGFLCLRHDASGSASLRDM